LQFMLRYQAVICDEVGLLAQPKVNFFKLGADLALLSVAQTSYFAVYTQVPSMRISEVGSVLES